MPSEIIPRSYEPHMKFLPYELPYMTDDLRKRAKAELFEDEDTRVHSLKLMRTMLKDEKNLVFLDDDDFLLTFLRARKFDVKKSFNLFKTFYHVKAKHYELYDNYDFEDCKSVYKDGLVGFLPYRDEEGCVILIIKTTNWDPCKHSMGDIMRATTTALLHAVHSPSTQVAGFKVIVDFKGFSYAQTMALSPTYLWLFAEALQNCFPARFRAVHIVNEGLPFKYIWGILRQFLTKKLKDRFQFHSKNVNGLHKYFAPSILSADFNGDLPPFDTVINQWIKKAEQMKDHLTYLHSFGYKKSRKAST
ncbi:clavesin-2 [Parasteatoda tepidariorum]|uniref:clavesin-2 n=1 Tax=Parasteatoda tepidariorum TaxID=114398 RepID=UPI00077F9E5F|nr:clavesin-2 [Parasteatoda tepidariorum]XP_020999890.1 clavesin-2 [Parasteatoda tepidariorum]XP_020999891.1 clavesin-2 [Parasteatoda tepidariorum]XP_020999892.1 clavesin-2 [Parasteatoda tepidariorum]